MFNLIKLIIFTVACTFQVTAFSQENFPIPQGNPNQLFYLQRTTNSNTIVCELNYKNGIVDAKEPVNVFWIRYSEQGQREELSYIQRKLAYGVKTTLIEKDKYRLTFVACKKYPLYLIKNADNKYIVYATINQKQAVLNCIFVKIAGGSFWSPDVEYIEMIGTDASTGKEVLERKKA